MIGKQINFYITGPDRLRLLESINSKVGCVLIKRSDTRPYHVADKLDKSEDDWAIAYLCEPSRAEHVLDAILSGTSDASTLLGIEFIQPKEEDGLIHRGRFWYAPKCLSAGEFVQKPKDFVDWANAVFATAKRELEPYKNGDWIGLEASSPKGRVLTS